MSQLISTIYKSLLRSVSDLIEEVNASTAVADAQYWAWETRADEDKLPLTTLIGLDGYSFDENKGLWVVRAGVTISTYQDANLHNEAEILDLVHKHYGDGKKVRLLTPDTGTYVSELYLNDFQIMPMAQSEIRNYRTVGIELMRTDSSTY